MDERRPYWSFEEFAAALGNKQDRGWWRMELLETAGYHAKNGKAWRKTRVEICRYLDGRRAEHLRRLARRERDEWRRADMVKQVARYESGRSPQAQKRKVNRELKHLMKRGLISYRGDDTGVAIELAKGVEVWRAKGAKTRVYLSAEALERFQRGDTKQDLLSLGGRDTKQDTKQDLLSLPKASGVPIDVPPTVPPTDPPSKEHRPHRPHRPNRPVSSRSKLLKEVRGRSDADPPRAEETSKQEPPAEPEPRTPRTKLYPRDLLPKPTKLDDWAAYLAASPGPRNNAHMWLYVDGVPGYPGVDTHRAVVHIPGPPHVDPDSTPAARVRLLGTAYRSAVREAYRRHDPSWTQPERFWRALPKPPRDGAEPTAAASRFLDCAERLHEHGIPPHVWAMHRVQSWLKTANVALTKAPPVKYVWSVADIQKQRGWVRGLIEQYAIGRDETAPRAAALRDRWLDMKREFYHRRVDCEEAALKVADDFFPPGYYEAECAAARDEAAVMTEMYRDEIAEGGWPWG